MRVALAGAAGALVLILVGSAQTALAVSDYLGSPFTPNSAVGMVVFRVDGELAQYPVWHPGMPALVVGVGILLLAASVLAAAITWKSRGRSVY